MIKRVLAAMMAFVLIFSCMPVTNAHAADTATTASGTTYYVSSLKGAEENDGTSESAPFASLLKINEITLQPGDRVLLERGSIFVDEYLHIQGSGSKDAPIIIDAYGDESQPLPLIQTNGNGVWYQDYGKSLDNSWHKYQGNVSSCILLYDVEYIEISNIAMTNEGNFAEGEVYNTYGRMDRTGVAGIAENIGTVDHIYLRNLDIRNVQGSVHDKHMANGGIYLLCHNPDDESATGVSRFDDVLIEGCRLDEVNRWGIAVGYTAYWDQFAYGSTIDPEVCQTYGSTNVVIRNNYLTNVGGDGITTMYCYQPLIEYNVLDGYCQDMTIDIYGDYNQRVAAGIWPWMCKTPILQYNEAYNSTLCPDAQAWDADWGDNAIYQYNYSCNNAGGAIMFCGQYACNTVFRYNISQYDLEGVLNLASSPNGEIYNNVFYIKEGVKVNRTGMSGGTGNTISNNIFYDTGSTPATATYGNWGDITAEWSNNIYYNYATTPDDAYAITADPLFVDPGNGPTGAQETGLVHSRSAFDGYQLQAGSPAIDAGMPIADNGGLDFFGNTVDLLPDIGAYDAGTCTADASSAQVVDLELGASVTLTDLTGDYADTTPTVSDSRIASVALARKDGVSQSTVSDTAATSLENGASYMICNVNTGSAVTSVMGNASYWGTQALLLSSDKTLADSNTWTLEASGSGYKIRSADGTYLSIALNASSLGTSGDTFTAATNGSDNVWTFLNSSGYYLDNLGRYDFLGGWTEIGNSSTWKLYKIETATLDAVTELTFTGLYPGVTNIVVGDTLYQVRVSGQLQEVELEVGETAAFTDETGNYTDADTGSLDETVATVALSGAATQTKSLGAKVTTLTSGGQYVIVNTRAAKPLTNAEATAAAAAGAGSGLNLTGTKENVVDNGVWTITGSDGSYTVQDCNGKYLTVGSTTAGITDTPTTLSLNYNGSTWTISLSSAYLNDFGGAGSCAAGWQDSSAATDSGSQWDIYEVALTDEESGGTQITFTAVGSGETHVQIGDIMYHITVADAAHSYENGFCGHCDEYEPAALVNGVYEIGNAGQLYWFAKLVDSGTLDADAILTADITVNDEVLIDGALNEDGSFRKWNAIGANAKQYAGTFDGQNFTVSGLYFDNDKTTGGYIGLIASMSETGVVRNVTVSDSYFCGYRYIGAVVGQNNGGLIENCRNAGAIITGSSSNIGGIAGGSTGTVTGCSSSGEISSDEGNNIGGIVGGNSGTVELCFNTGAVLSECCSDEHCVGGIVGENTDGTIRNCYNTGAITNDGSAAGGIAGKADGGAIENCHNVGDVSGKTNAGGVIGKAYNTPTVGNCYYLADSETDALDGTTAKSAAVFASGEVAYLLNGSTSEGDLVWKQTLGSAAYPTFAGGTVYQDGDSYINGTHSHTPAEAVRENEVPATCTEDGSYDSVVYCSDCGAEISRDTVTVPATGHTYEDGVCTVCGTAEGAAQNTATNAVYATVSEALKAAEAGQTVILLTDCTESDVMVTPGITLDLNGHELTANYTVGFSSASIVDNVGSGRLITSAANVVLDEGNAMIPVYDGEGYLFTKAGFAIAQDTTYTGEGIKINAVAYPVNMEVVELLKDGGTDNNVQIMILLSWDTDQGVGTQRFVFTDAVVGQVYSSNDGTWSGYGKMFSMVVTGFGNIENLNARIAVISDTNAEYISSITVGIS